MYNIGKIKAQKGVVIMNRIAVIYCSVHHKNTEKLISYVDTTDKMVKRKVYAEKKEE